MGNKRSIAEFVEPMLLLPTAELPEGNDWLNELKLDGYRALAFKSSIGVHLRSRVKACEERSVTDRPA
jgi:bifunctional non-homologous end joining protein LigD